MNKEKNNSDDTVLFKLSALVFLVVVGLWLLTYYNLVSKSESARGTYGDMFGGVNALFSGLAFGGIIITILLQKRELSLQRKELEDTREVLKTSTNSQIRSENAQKRQAENLKISAKLSALSTLLQHYTNALNNTYGLDVTHNITSKIDSIVSQIETILETKEEH